VLLFNQSRLSLLGGGRGQMTTARRGLPVLIGLVGTAIAAGAIAVVAAAGGPSSGGRSIAGVVDTGPVVEDAVGLDGCYGFVPRAIGNGLTVSLPPSATSTGGVSTADPGPIHAATSATFSLDGTRVDVGRRIGAEVVDEAGVAQRLVGDVVIFVRTDDADLAGCLLESASYDAAGDELDG
jgi:hypothetical protein